MYNYIIRNAKILDGSGNPWRIGDVAISGDKIAKVGDLSKEKAITEIDATGLYLSPGFIDIHTHSESILFQDGRAHAHLLQGVTTNVLGQCGSSPYPFTSLRKDSSDKSNLEVTWETTGDFLNQMKDKKISVNVVPVVGQGAIRQCVMGFNPDKPNQEQLDEMKKLLIEAMDSGCFGVSTGLIYTPSAYADTDEIIELTKVISDYDGLYFSHIRGENDYVLDAINEALRVGEEADVPVQISHLKAMGRHMWGKSVEILQTIDNARNRNIDVTFDQYPYKASATGLAAILPPWAHEGGAYKMRERLADPKLREKMKHEMINGSGNWISFYKGVEFDNILITDTLSDKSIVGKTIAQIAKERNDEDEFKTCFDILQTYEGRVSIVYFTISDEDIERIMKHPLMMVGSDSSARPIDGPLTSGLPHPRTFGSFITVLATYVRDKGVITLEEAIRKMTAAPAYRLGLWDRGLILPGNKGDLVLFDLSKIGTKSDYTNPVQFPTGIKKVFVNGILSVDDGEHTGAAAGYLLRKNE
jgi:N-acyl-D-amino-acid deacylase